MINKQSKKFTINYDNLKKCEKKKKKGVRGKEGLNKMVHNDLQNNRIKKKIILCYHIL